MVPFDLEKHQRLDAAIDNLRALYGRKVVYFGGLQEGRDEAPMRISSTHIADLEIECDSCAISRPAIPLAPLRASA